MRDVHNGWLTAAAAFMPAHGCAPRHVLEQPRGKSRSKCRPDRKTQTTGADDCTGLSQQIGCKTLRLVGCATEVDSVERKALKYNEVDKHLIRTITSHNGIVSRRRNLFARKALDIIVDKESRSSTVDPDA